MLPNRYVLFFLIGSPSLSHTSSWGPKSTLPFPPIREGNYEWKTASLRSILGNILYIFSKHIFDLFEWSTAPHLYLDPQPLSLSSQLRSEGKKRIQTILQMLTKKTASVTILLMSRISSLIRRLWVHFLILTITISIIFLSLSPSSHLYSSCSIPKTGTPTSKYFEGINRLTGEN